MHRRPFEGRHLVLNEKKINKFFFINNEEKNKKNFINNEKKKITNGIVEKMLLRVNNV